MLKKSIYKSICLCIALGMMLGGCGKSKATQQADDAINVTVFEAGEDSINATADYTGQIMGAQSTTVSAMVSGKANGIYVEEGDYVTAGTILLLVDATTYQLAYNQALAAYNSALSGKKSAEASYNSVTGGSTQQSLAQLESALNAAKLAHDNALDTYNKNKTLFDMGAISQLEFNGYKTAYENAKLNYDTAQTNYNLTKDVVSNESKAVAAAGVDSAQAGIQSAKAALDIAANNLKNCTVTAPISGYISAKNVNKGQMVSAGIALFNITDTSSVNIEINVTESVIPLISVGTKATINVSSAGLSNLEGTVAIVNPVKNAQTGLYTVKISLPNADGALKEGMIANLTLITESSDNTLVVPSNALLQSDEDGYYVYIVNGDAAEKRPVQTGIESSEFTEILSGINLGDKVVVDGKDYISKNNNKVKIVTE
ncbi:MAG: efflux RND transporter periplasmic adaptor subunit [Clostridia bacterium]|nr:efflux RND transporter periplasmic adaptor subunit [Clostridia bacterium]